MAPNVALVTYTSDVNYPMFEYLIESLKYWGWPEPVVLGNNGGFMGHPFKMDLARNELPKLLERGYTHAIYTDAWDVMCCGPWEKVLDACDDDGACGPVGALLSGDAGCWTAEDTPWTMFPDLKYRWKYVNGGGWMGSIEYLLDDLLRGCENERVNDQWHLARQWVKRPAGLRLDNKCDVFQCLSHTPVETFDVVGDRVKNLETGTFPVLIHGAGRTDMSWVPYFGPRPWKLER